MQPWPERAVRERQARLLAAAEREAQAREARPRRAPLLRIRLTLEFQLGRPAGDASVPAVWS